MFRKIVLVAAASAGGALASACSGGSTDESRSESAADLSSSTSAASSITDDTYVTSEYPGDTHGTDTYLVLGTAATNAHHSYVKIKVSGVPEGATDVKASLKVTSQTTASETIAAHCATSSTWTQSTLTWNNQPGFAARVVSSVTSETEGDSATFDVSSCVTGNGTFSVVLDQPEGAVVKLDSSESSVGRPTVAVSYANPPACSGPDDLLVPCPGKRWEGANPTASGDGAEGLKTFETMQGAQLGVVHVFREPGENLWSNSGTTVGATFEEQIYLGTTTPSAKPRYVYLGYRPNADWSTFTGASTDSAATTALIHADAAHTAALFKVGHRKLWINAVNHEAERYVFGCGGGNASDKNNTVKSYQAAWRNVVAIFDSEFAAAGLSKNHADPSYPVVWAMNTQNLDQKTNAATCKDENGNGLDTFREVMLALVPRTTSGALVIQWFGWNPYTTGPGRTLPDVIDDGYDYLTTSAPADLKALPWHFGEFGYINAPTKGEGDSDFTGIATDLDMGRWPNVRLLMYFEEVSFENPTVSDFAPAFATYATSSTMVRY